MAEEQRMDQFQSANQSPHQSRETQVLDAVVGYRYFAPWKLGMDETHHRMRAEAAVGRLLAETAPPGGYPRLTDRVRQRVGALLIRLGTTLQGVPSGTATVPNVADPRSAPA
jgi:hypothetical protein